MTSPNFLSHIQHTGFIPQPGIGDILGQQFQHLAQTRGVVREQDQRQQQIDQLGQYYQGQVNEMQRLRDQQEQAAMAAQQKAMYDQQTERDAERLFPLDPNADEKTRWETMVKRAVLLTERNHPANGAYTNLVNSTRPKEDKGVTAVEPDRDIIDSKGNLIRAGRPKDDTQNLFNVPPEGVVFDPVTRKPIYQAPPRERPAGEGSLTPAQQATELRSLRNAHRAEVTPIDKALRVQAGIDKAVLQAALKGELASQYKVMVSFIQSLDNSTVKQGEVDLYRASEPLLQRANNFIAKYGEGKAQIVNPASIQQMVELTRQAQQRLKAERQRITKYYVKQAGLAGIKDPEARFREDDEEVPPEGGVTKSLKDKYGEPPQ